MKRLEVVNYRSHAVEAHKVKSVSPHHLLRSQCTRRMDVDNYLVNIESEVLRDTRIAPSVSSVCGHAVEQGQLLGSARRLFYDLTALHSRKQAGAGNDTETIARTRAGGYNV
jgi:hypothetical protein